MHKKLFYFRTAFLELNTILFVYCLIRGGYYNVILAGYFTLLIIFLQILTYLEWKKQKKELMEDMLFHILSITCHASLFVVLLRTVFDQNILSTYFLEEQGIVTHGINIMYLNSNFIYISILFMLLILYGCIKGKTKKRS